jgi:prevent-host-death family protein
MSKATKKTRIPAPASSSLEIPSTIEVPAGMFKDTCLALMNKVRDTGTHVVITKHGNPVARLVPADYAAASAHGFMRGTVIAQKDIVSPDLEAWGES